MNTLMIVCHHYGYVLTILIYFQITVVYYFKDRLLSNIYLYFLGSLILLTNYYYRLIKTQIEFLGMGYKALNVMMN